MRTYTDQQINNKVDAISNQLIDLSHKIHAKPEVTNTEFFASQLLACYLQTNGFEVTSDVCGHSTAFIATFDTLISGPHVAITAEYDALPGLGHACGHNIIGSSSVGAAVVLKDIVECGKITVFGTPGEEGGPNGSSKGSFVREGYLDDVDFSCSIHPSAHTSPTKESIACRVLEIEFFGTPAHAAGSPEYGVNALDALINFYNQINALRQQLTSDVRIHGIILDGGVAPNIIPEYTRARFYVRAQTKQTAAEVTEKFKVVGEAAAQGAFARVKITEIQNAVDNLVPNKTLDNIFVSKLEALGEVIINSPGSFGSTDVGNISQVVPTVHPTCKIGPDSLVGHTAEFCISARSESGDKGLIVATKAIASSCYQVFTDPELLKEIKLEFANSIEKN
ncbi:M20 family metallopeptidase [Mollicutes bacterium LVI A0039]|nr:M20 family metallopeptidase [Mollicutes bacterium LVI A0039]